MVKRVILCAIAGVLSSYAQQGGRADSLVSQAAAVARNATSWSAEGSLVGTTRDGKKRSEQFKIAFQLPARARLETTGPNPLLRICDGTAQWTYYPRMNAYVRVMLPKIGPCAYPLNAWPPLPLNMRSPKFDGKSSVIMLGPRQCDVVRGVRAGLTSDSKPSPIILCIDPISRDILRFQVDESTPDPATLEYTFSSLQRNVQLDADLFKFQPPEGSREVAIINWLDPQATPTDSAERISDQMNIPELTSLVAPAPRFPGPSLSPNSAVIVTAEVNGQGLIDSVKVRRSLGADLDHDALEALAKWHFQPAIKNGKPIRVVVAIAVRFSGPISK